MDGLMEKTDRVSQSPYSIPIKPLLNPCNCSMPGAAGSFGYPVGFSSAEGDREREREAMMNRLEDFPGMYT